MKCTTTTPKGPALPTPSTAAKAGMQHHRVVDPDRLTSPLSADFADLVCAVCEGLPLRPMQTSCEHYFCSAEGCPEGWDRGSSPECPQCREAVTSPLTAAPRMVRNMVDGLQVRCRHNPEHVVRLDQLQQHEEEECGDLPQGCFLCGARVPQQNLAEHLEATHTWAEVALKQVAMQEAAAAQQQERQEATNAELRETLVQQQAAMAQQERAMADLRDTLMQQFQEKLGTDPHSFRAAGLTAVRCRRDGYSAMDCKEAGYSAMECKEAGYSAMECKEAGYSAMECKEGGYSAMEAGYSARDCMEAGLVDRAEQCLAMGYTAQHCKDSGFYHPLDWEWGEGYGWEEEWYPCCQSRDKSHPGCQFR